MVKPSSAMFAPTTPFKLMSPVPVVSNKLSPLLIAEASTEAKSRLSVLLSLRFPKTLTAPSKANTPPALISKSNSVEPLTLFCIKLPVKSISPAEENKPCWLMVKLSRFDVAPIALFNRTSPPLDTKVRLSTLPALPTTSAKSISPPAFKLRSPLTINEPLNLILLAAVTSLLSWFVPVTLLWVKLPSRFMFCAKVNAPP